MLRKIFFILIISVSGITFAQPRYLEFKSYQELKLLDSINVNENSQFVIKDKLTDWSHNFNDVSYIMAIYEDVSFSGGTTKFSKNLGGYEYDHGNLITYQTPIGTIQPNVLPGNNPGDYVIETTASLNQIGKYYYVAIIKGKSERGNYFEDAGYWIVTCNLQTVKSSLEAFNILKEYHYGEDVSFSFSVDGFDNLKEYSYRIFEGDGKKEIFSGLGSYISLDFLTQNPAKVGKSFVIEGYYSGRILKFFNPQISAIDSTVWGFKLVKPDNFQEKTLWTPENEFQNLDNNDVVDALDMNQGNSRQFRFNYYTKLKNKDLVILPEMKDLVVKSVPSDFLSRISQNYKIYPDGLYQVLEIIPNQTFLESIPGDEVRKVSIEIDFTTQFGDSKRLKYEAFVF